MARPTATDSIRPFYADWAGYNRRVAEALGRLTEEALALGVTTPRGGDVGPWPVWAVAGHAVGLTLSANGRDPIDLWPSADWAADAPRALREG